VLVELDELVELRRRAARRTRRRVELDDVLVEELCCRGRFERRRCDATKTPPLKAGS